MRNHAFPTRREALAGFTIGALVTSTDLAAAAPFRFSALDHVALTVNDVEKSVRFYARLFGSTVLKENAGSRHHVKAGPNYIAMNGPSPGRAAQAIDHLCIGVVNFDVDAAKRALDQMGIQYREVTGYGLFVPDPDGTLLQIWAENSWSRLGSAGTQVDVPPQGEPLLRPTGIDHILINVSSVEVSTAFYEKVFGSVINPASRPRRTWFSAGGGNRLGLALAGPNQKPGIDHYCFSAPFDRGALTKALESAGAKIIPGDVPAGIDFLDIDGIHVQVIPPPAA